MTLRIIHGVPVGVVLVLSSCTQEPFLAAHASRRSMDGSTERCVISIQAADAAGNPGRGTVQLTVSAGSFLEGSEVPLVEGAASATFRCNPRDDDACNGDIPIGVEWRNQSATVTVKVGSSVSAPTLRWRVTLSGTLATLNDATVAPDGTLWVAGDEGVVFRNGARVAADTRVSLKGIFAPLGGGVLFAGAGGTLLSWTGTSLQPITTGVADDFTGIWGASATDFFVVSSQGRAFHFDGAALTQVYDAGAPLFAVHGASRDDVWVAGDGVLWHLVNRAWAPVTPPTLGNWRSVRVDARGEVWLAGERADPSGSARGIAMQGPEWRVTTFPDVARDVLTFDGVERFVVTDGDVFRKVGDEAWTSVRAPLGGLAVTGRTPAEIAVVGIQGLMLRATP